MSGIKKLKKPLNLWKFNNISQIKNFLYDVDGNIYRNLNISYKVLNEILINNIEELLPKIVSENKRLLFYTDENLREFFEDVEFIDDKKDHYLSYKYPYIDKTFKLIFFNKLIYKYLINTENTNINKTQNKVKINLLREFYDSFLSTIFLAHLNRTYSKYDNKGNIENLEYLLKSKLFHKDILGIFNNSIDLFLNIELRKFEIKCFECSSIEEEIEDIKEILKDQRNINFYIFLKEYIPIYINDLLFQISNIEECFKEQQKHKPYLNHINNFMIDVFGVDIDNFSKDKLELYFCKYEKFYIKIFLKFLIS